MTEPRRISRQRSHPSGSAAAVGPSVMDVADWSGLLALSPSDLVFESSPLHGVEYYDFILSTTEWRDDSDKDLSVNSCKRYSFPLTSTRLVTSSEPTSGSSDRILPATTLQVPVVGSTSLSRGYQLFLAKLDAQTNVEWFETARVPSELLAKTGIPSTELAMITMGVLIWRNVLSRSRLLCLVNRLSDDSSAALEALKRATTKFKCVHHVLTIGSRRARAASTVSAGSDYSQRSYRSSISSTSSQESMKLRVLMCQSRSELADLPAQAVRETKFLLAPSSNPLLCLCSPLT